MTKNDVLKIYDDLRSKCNDGILELKTVSLTYTVLEHLKDLYNNSKTITSLQEAKNFFERKNFNVKSNDVISWIITI